jgi:hypothetical protein
MWGQNLKKIVSRTRPTVRKHCDSKYFFAWFATTFSFFVTGNRDRKFRYNLRSELVYTFKWTKSVARLWRNQINKAAMEFSIFSNSSHLEWRAGLSDTILKGTHTRTIPARFGLIWFRGFRGEDLNVKVYDVRRTPSDGKSSHGLWPGELKMCRCGQRIKWQTQHVQSNLYMRSPLLSSHLYLKKGHHFFSCHWKFYTNWTSCTSLDINACPIPVKTDVGQVDLVSDGTSEKMTVLPFEGYFLW